MQAVLIWASLVTLGAFAQEAKGPSMNPVVDLYVQRLELQKLELKRLESNVYFLDVNLKSLEASAGAVSERSIRDGHRDLESGKLLVEIQKTKIKEAAALAEIAKYRVQHGVDMPLCQEKQ